MNVLLNIPNIYFKQLEQHLEIVKADIILGLLDPHKEKWDVKYNIFISVDVVDNTTLQSVPFLSTPEMSNLVPYALTGIKLTSLDQDEVK